MANIYRSRGTAAQMHTKSQTCPGAAANVGACPGGPLPRCLADCPADLLAAGIHPGLFTVQGISYH